MPTGGLTGNFATQTTRALSVWVGQRDVTALIIADTFEIEDAGASQGAFVATLNERLADLPEVTDQAFVRVFDEVRATEMWRGFLKSRKPTLVPAWTNTTLRATDHGELLDRYIPGPFSRPSGESDAARIGYLWGQYASPYLSGDLSNVDIVNATLPEQIFHGVTLRQALDMTAAQASPSADWYLDQTGHLHYFSSETNAAPKNVTSDTPAGDEVAPTNLVIDYDTMTYANAIYVNGQTTEGSGWVYDHADIARIGTIVSASPLDAPDCSTEIMRDALGAMYLGRVAGSIARGAFTVYSHDADGWRGGQTLDVRSADVGIDANFRIARVRTRQLAPSSFQYDVEFGGSRRGSSGGTTGALESSLITPGSALAGEIFALQTVHFRAVGDLADQATILYRGAGDVFQILTPDAGFIQFNGTSGELGLYPAFSGTNINTSRVLLGAPLRLGHRSITVATAGTTFPVTSPNSTGVILQLNNTSGGPLTMTGTPTMVDPPNQVGQQLVVLTNISSDPITLQDESALTGSNFRLGAATRTLGLGGSLILTFNPYVAAWYELASSPLGGNNPVSSYANSPTTIVCTTAGVWYKYTGLAANVSFTPRYTGQRFLVQFDCTFEGDVTAVWYVASRIDSDTSGSLNAWGRVQFVEGTAGTSEAASGSAIFTAAAGDVGNARYAYLYFQSSVNTTTMSLYSGAAYASSISVTPIQ